MWVHKGKVNIFQALQWYFVTHFVDNPTKFVNNPTKSYNFVIHIVNVFSPVKFIINYYSKIFTMPNFCYLITINFYRDISISNFFSPKYNKTSFII